MPSALFQKTPYGSFGGQPGGTLDKYKNKDLSPSVMDKEEELPMTAEELARSLAERDAIGPPTVGPVSIDPTDWLTPGGLAKVAAVLKGVLAPAAATSAAMLVGSRVAGPTSQLARTLPRQAGAILPGGRPDLNILHGTNDSTLISLTRELQDTGRATLHSPSFEISTIPEGRPGFGWGDTSIIPVPKAVDPKNRPDAHLYNRDAYVSRSGGKPYTKEELEYIINDSSLTEGAIPPISHSLAIMASPNFRSLAEYEASPVGAAILNKGLKEISYSKLYEMGISREMLDDARNSKEGLLDLYAEISKRANSGDKIARGYLGRLQRQGSDYAELKLVRDLDLNPSTTAAIIHTPGFYGEQADQLKAAFDKKGIPVGTVEDFLPQAERKKLGDFLAATLKPYKELIAATPEAQTAGWLSSSDVGWKYLDKGIIDELAAGIEKKFPIGAEFTKTSHPYIPAIIRPENVEGEIDYLRNSLRSYYMERMRKTHYRDVVNAITEEAVKK